MGQNGEETKNQKLVDQVFQMRVTSGKPGNSPQVETLVKRKTISTNNMGIHRGVQELDRRKLDLPDVAQRASAPMRGRS